jgi:hypothetical protein
MRTGKREQNRVAHPLQSHRKGWVIERQRDRFLSISQTFKMICRFSILAQLYRRHGEAIPLRPMYHSLVCTGSTRT